MPSDRIKDEQGYALTLHSAEKVSYNLCQQGFAIWENLIPTDILEKVHQIVLDLFAKRSFLSDRYVNTIGYNRSSGTLEILRTSKLRPQLLKTEVFERCKKAASYIMREPACHAGDHAIFKLPNSDSRTEWHQDAAYDRGLFPTGGVSFWIPMQKVDEHNGCLRFLPNQHRCGLRPHVKLAQHTSTLRMRHVDERTAITCPLEPGDVTVHMPLTPHEAFSNKGDRLRSAWIVAFAPKKFYALKRGVNFAYRNISRLGGGR
jgi:hypothetical protein